MGNRIYGQAPPIDYSDSDCDFETIKESETSECENNLENSKTAVDVIINQQIIEPNTVTVMHTEYSEDSEREDSEGEDSEGEDGDVFLGAEKAEIPLQHTNNVANKSDDDSGEETVKENEELEEIWADCSISYTKSDEDQNSPVVYICSHRRNGKLCYYVTIPTGVRPGEQFLAAMNKWHKLNIICPRCTVPGTQVRIRPPDELWEKMGAVQQKYTSWPVIPDDQYQSPPKRPSLSDNVMHTKTERTDWRQSPRHLAVLRKMRDAGLSEILSVADKKILEQVDNNNPPSLHENIVLETTELNNDLSSITEESNYYNEEAQLTLQNKINKLFLKKYFNKWKGITINKIVGWRQNLKPGDNICFKFNLIWQQGKIITKKNNIIWVCPRNNNIKFISYHINSDQLRQFIPPPPLPPLTPHPSIYNSWLNNLQINDRVDVLDTDSNQSLPIWREGIIIDIEYGQYTPSIKPLPSIFKVHFCGWNEKWDTRLPATKTYFAQAYTKVVNWRKEIKIGDYIEYKYKTVNETGPLKWYQGKVTQKSTLALLPDGDGPAFHIQGLFKQQSVKFWVSINSDTIAKKGTHIHNWKYNTSTPKCLKTIIAKKIANDTIDSIINNLTTDNVGNSILKLTMSQKRARYLPKEARKIVDMLPDDIEQGIHIDSLYWTSCFEGNKFTPHSIDECRIFHHDSDEKEKKMHIVLYNFLKKHILKYECQEEERNQKYNIIEKRINVRWRVWCEWLGRYIEQWYAGFISDYDEDSDKHTIVYDDGETRTYNLESIEYELLDTENSVKYSENIVDEEKTNLGDVKLQLKCYKFTPRFPTHSSSRC